MYKELVQFMLLLKKQCTIKSSER